MKKLTKRSKVAATPPTSGENAKTSFGRSVERRAFAEESTRSAIRPLSKAAPVVRDVKAKMGASCEAIADEDSGRRWIESAYQAFVMKRTASTVHQDARLDADKALTVGEIRALKAVGFAASPSIAKQARNARENMLHTYFDIVQNSASAADVARYLSVDVSRIRQRARERTLYAFDVDGEHRFPLVQFEKSREVPGLAKVLPELPADLTPIEFVTWFVSDSTELGDPEGDVHPSPREWLMVTGDTEPVIALAKDY